MKHLYQSKDFTVKNSNIPGAGFGLFANRDFEKGETLGEYKGKLITKEEGDKCEKRGIDCSHMLDIIGLNVPPYSYIHPNKKMLLGYINHAPKKINGLKVEFKKSPNVILQNIEKPPYVIVISIRKIEKGDEIYLNYGSYFTKQFLKIEGIKDFFITPIK